MILKLHKKYLLIILLSIVCISCRINKTNLNIEKLTVNFSGGNNYPKKSNQGGIEISAITFDTSISILRKFDVYSPSINPVIIKLYRKQNAIILSGQNGKEFIFVVTDSLEQNCNYNCRVYSDKADKVTFTSSLGLFPYWHGFEVLGGHPLFMRHHYYTLKIKKANGNKLKMQWTYSMQKYRPHNSNRKKWSGDYCVDNVGGLTKLKINN